MTRLEFGIAATIVVLLIGALLMMFRQDAECRERGGRMVGDGTYTYVWQVVDFKTGAGVLVPYPNMVCTVARKP